MAKPEKKYCLYIIILLFFTKENSNICLYFVVVFYFYQTIISLVLVGYEMITYM